MSRQVTNMPVLKDFRKTAKISLPDYEGSEVVIFDSLLLKDFSPVSPTAENDNIKKALPKLIKSWNFTDEAGKDMPVTEENVLLLKITSINYLVQQVGKISIEEKKN